MKILLIPVILILLSFLNTGCEQSVIGIPAVEEPIAETIMNEVKMERTIIMNPIPAALGYLFKNGLLKGIIAETDRTNFLQISCNAQIDSKLSGIVLTDFFIKDGKKYFSFTDRYQDENKQNIEKELYFEQTGQTVKEIEIMPDKPAEPAMIIGEMGPFNFTSYKWENTDYNKLTFVESGAIISTAKGFDSAVLTDKGLLFSQPEKLSREAGLWFMGNEQKGGPTRIGEYQIIYK